MAKTATLDKFGPLYVIVWFTNGHIAKHEPRVYTDEKSAKRRVAYLTKIGIEGQVVRELHSWVEVPREDEDNGTVEG